MANKLGRGQWQSTEIPCWWNLSVHRGFSSCTHGSPAEFKGKGPRSSNASLPHKVLAYKPTHWPLWDFTCPLLTHCQGALVTTRAVVASVAHSCCPSQRGVTAQISSLCCCGGSTHCLPGGKPTCSDAVIKLPFRDGIHRDIMKTDEYSEGQVGQVWPGLSSPRPRLAQKKKKKKRWWKEKGRKEPSGKEKETGWILFQNFVRILFFLCFWGDGSGTETHKMKTSISLQHCPGGLSQEN